MRRLQRQIEKTNYEIPRFARNDHAGALVRMTAPPRPALYLPAPLRPFAEFRAGKGGESSRCTPKYMNESCQRMTEHLHSFKVQLLGLDEDRGARRV